VSDGADGDCGAAGERDADSLPGRSLAAAGGDLCSELGIVLDADELDR